jgi:magnesium transporter
VELLMMRTVKSIPLRFYPNQSNKVGQSPGTLATSGAKPIMPAVVTLMNYDHQKCETQQIESLADLRRFKDTSTNTWINVEGLTDTRVVAEIGKIFDIHPLVLEDIVNSRQRIKIEVFDDYIFIVLKMITYAQESESFHQQNVSLILGNHFLISFHEERGQVFEAIRKRVQRKGSRAHTFGCDYLVYRLIDLIVDHYFVVIENYGEQIEHLEIELSEKADSDLLNEIQALKRELLIFMAAIFPLNDVLIGMMKEDVALITDNTRVFLSDVSDHFKQVIDTITTCREIVADLLSGYLAMVNYKMNEVIKILTIITVIFIPLSFIAGVYGMNFEFMPELHFKFMYPLIWVLMIGAAGLMIVYFKRKKWF